MLHLPAAGYCLVIVSLAIGIFDFSAIYVLSNYTVKFLSLMTTIIDICPTQLNYSFCNHLLLIDYQSDNILYLTKVLCPKPSKQVTVVDSMATQVTVVLEWQLQAK